MKVYLVLNNEVITGYSFEPIDGLVEVEVENPKDINLGNDVFENGVIVKKPEKATVIKAARIIELKKLLAESDYQCLKHADGDLTDEEYEAIKVQRHAWRTCQRTDGKVLP